VEWLKVKTLSSSPGTSKKNKINKIKSKNKKLQSLQYRETEPKVIGRIPGEFLTQWPIHNVYFKGRFWPETDLTRNPHFLEGTPKACTLKNA
jgi:hypothetical protein